MKFKTKVFKVVLFIYAILFVGCSKTVNDLNSDVSENTNQQSSISPHVTISDDLKNLTDFFPIYINNSPVKLPILINDGKYLCSSNDNNTIYFSRMRTPNNEIDEENIVKEDLWIKIGDEEKKLIDKKSFYGIEQASLSSDGRYLAILDAEPEKKILYVLDFEENELLNLGEEGLGAYTFSFVWDNANPIIYAFTGYNSVQLLQYDFSKSDVNKISSVEEMPGVDSNLQLIEKKLYFCDSSAGENGEVYSLEIGSPKRNIIGEGMDFKISPDAKYVALLQEKQGDEVSVYYNLGLKDLNNENFIPDIAENVATYAFDKTGKFLYFTTQQDEGITDNYPFAFKMYDISNGTNKLLGYLKTGDFVPSFLENKIYLLDYSFINDAFCYTTYIYE